MGDNRNSKVRSTNAFGREISYDPQRQQENSPGELKKIIKKANKYKAEREREIEKTLLALFSDVQGKSRAIGNHLSKIPFGNATLAEPWRRMQEMVSQLWEKRGKELAYFSSSEIDRLQGFIEQHPAYEEVSAEENGAIDSLYHLGELSLDDLIEMTETELNESMQQILAEQ